MVFFVRCVATVGLSCSTILAEVYRNHLLGREHGEDKNLLFTKNVMNNITTFTVFVPLKNDTSYMDDQHTLFNDILGPSSQVLKEDYLLMI